ncbi:MAG: glycosyltransferase [Actinomycetota bacterium]
MHDLVPSEQPNHRLGRVVMIVDNVIDGDSRVQKTAVSIADAGWDVTLIGRSATGRRQDSTLGRAAVIKLPMPYALHGYRRRAPGRSLRWPLAYRSTEVAIHRRACVEARMRYLRTRRAKLSILRKKGTSPVVWGLPGLMLLIGRVQGKIIRSWYLLRNYELRRGINHRKAPTAPLDNFIARSWHFLLGRHSWRKLEPLLSDYEIIYGPVVDSLRPDIIHAHDFRMVGLAVRAAIRSRGAGRKIKVIYDAHEFLPGVRQHSLRWKLGNESQELSYACQADAVVTVSATLADMLKDRHKLAMTPLVVLNAPEMTTNTVKTSRGFLEESAGRYHTDPDIRTQCGLTDSERLLVYSGSAAPQRGLAIMIEGLPLLSNDVHVALVVSSRSDHIKGLERRAVQLGVMDRLHVLSYVAHDQVVQFLRSADIGVIPILHFPNHEIALITKYFEYAQAKLPIVVSDVRAMAEATQKLGNGEVFIAEDVTSFVKAVHTVLDSHQSYRATYTDEILNAWSWQQQADVLSQLYSQLIADSASGGQQKGIPLGVTG